MKRKYDKAHREWANLVKNRDGFKCVVCGEDKIVYAHHLIPWEVEKFRYSVENGITLCGKHHTKYGRNLSPHNDYAGLFFLFLMETKRELWDWFKHNATN